MKPIIGIVALYDEKGHSYWMLPEYTEAINKSGGIPIILPYNVDIEAIMPHLDGVLFTGGQDINPLLYDEGSAQSRYACSLYLSRAAALKCHSWWYPLSGFAFPASFFYQT